MLPPVHLLSSGAVVIVTGLFMGVAPQQLIAWLLVSTVATVAIDLDHFLIQLMM